MSTVLGKIKSTSLLTLICIGLAAAASPAFAAVECPSPGSQRIVIREAFGAFDSATMAKYPGFGSPLYEETGEPTGANRVGFDSGICHVSYTAAQMRPDKVNVPAAYGALGLYECTWTSHIYTPGPNGTRRGSITTSGTFSADPSVASEFAIIGGTGEFEGAKGTMTTDANANCTYSKDPTSCLLTETYCIK